MLSENRLPHIVAILLCALAISSTLQWRKEIKQRIDQQEQLIQVRTQWNNQIEAMRPLEVRWKKELPSIAVLTDQYRIVQHLNFPTLTLALPAQGLTINEPVPVSYQSRPTGLLWFAVSNLNNHLSLTAPDFATAWQALARLQSRPDVRYSRARIENLQGVPTLTLEGFGLLARAENE